MEQQPDHHAGENLPAHESPRPPSQQDQTDDFDLRLPGPGEMRIGSRPGDLRYVIVRPDEPELRRIQTGVLEATEAAEKPEGVMAQAAYWAKRLLIGVPLTSERAEQERLSKFKALAMLSSDAISPVSLLIESIARLY